MNRLVSYRWFRFALMFMALLVIALLSACWQSRIWSLGDFRAYQEMCRYQIGRDLWFGRIRPGQSVDVVIGNAPPHDMDQFGDFVSLIFYPGGPLGPDELPCAALELIAKDGRLVQAWAVSCT